MGMNQGAMCYLDLIGRRECVIGKILDVTHDFFLLQNVVMITAEPFPVCSHI